MIHVMYNKVYVPIITWNFFFFASVKIAFFFLIKGITTLILLFKDKQGMEAFEN